MRVIQLTPWVLRISSLFSLCSLFCHPVALRQSLHPRGMGGLEATYQEELAADVGGGHVGRCGHFNRGCIGAGLEGCVG